MSEVKYLNIMDNNEQKNVENAKTRCDLCSKTRCATIGEPICECNKSDSSSIRLGPVPESAFRPPSPRPASKPESGKGDHIQESISVATSGGGSTKYEIISIREKHGEFRKAIPCMPMPVAVFCCLLNVIFPGTGTCAASLTVLCGCRTEQTSIKKALGYNLVAALLQLITAPIIVGWIWSVYWGITFINLSVTKALQVPDNGGDSNV